MFPFRFLFGTACFHEYRLQFTQPPERPGVADGRRPQPLREGLQRKRFDRMRRAAHQARTESTDDIDSLGWADPGNSAEVCAEASAAARAVMQLRPEQRQVLELGILQGLSHSEIADVLQMPLGTVKTMMRRGLIQVRELMGIQNAASDGVRS